MVGTYFELKLGSAVKTYCLYETTAPARYDGFGTIELASSEFGGKWTRLILIETTDHAWQCGRYSSGLFGATPSDLLSEADIADALYQRIKGPVATD